MFGDFKRKLKDRHPQGPAGRNSHGIPRIEDSSTFEELQMTFKSWSDWLRCIIEHDGEYFHK